ncbi:ABC transporter ATP-binding protein/permease [Sphingomonas sp. RG327]|uniref:ABC transporter ATP-binding protein/permease n=1 Tax=Sphingomonas anseongensis TaxID=2908207 RepID=A0ABT0RD95_9SPHN|nr:ABC transporter ATP-binding protein [Sphingomonas anseongensis]MCL6678050.1 ABC transporter ATP-binding protein/permease [Sphingomonas anseongensis]
MHDSDPLARDRNLEAWPKRATLWRDLGQIYAEMSAARRRQFYSLIVLMCVGAVAELATIGSVVPFLSLLANPGAVHGISWLNSGGLPVAALLFALLVLLAGAIRLYLTFSVQDFSYRLGHEIMVAIERRVLMQPYSFHIESNSSSMLAAIEKVEVLVFDALLPSMQALASAVLAIFIVAALLYIEPVTALIAASAFSVVYLGVSALARRRLAVNSNAIGRSFNERMKIAQESLGGIRDIIIDGNHDLYVRLFREVDLQLCVARANTAFISTAPRYVIETVGIIILAGIAVVMSERDGGLAAAVPALGAIALGAQRLLPLLQQVYTGWSTSSGYISIVSQVVELLRLPTGQPIDDGRAMPVKKSIEVTDLCFAYPTRKAPALDGISFEIPAGAAVALIGETGSGKSTLADLLMGLLHPTSGVIRVDGAALTEQNRRQWQRSIAHVPQAIFVADSTIAGNIALGAQEDVDRNRVIEAAKVAQLSDFVESLPNGYETLVGERGIRLSGGQRQRLGIARAIYKGTPVLVLDEATSALDEATEKAIFDGLEKLRQRGRTLIIIAHRLSTIARCDLVMRLQAGRVVEAGRFADVVPPGSRQATTRSSRDRKSGTRRSKTAAARRTGPKATS